MVYGLNAQVRPRFLAALLRLADECDLAHNRTPEVIYYTIHPTDDAEAEFARHLNITGVGQLSEAHKIYISAIARDPEGAQTLRQLTQKVQHELDAVKAILAQYGIPLDTVELRLETRGFIDKPISFEIDKDKIVQLLIGDHLYARRDVALRELVQNAIDACMLRHELQREVIPTILVDKRASGELVVEDNGIGMDYVSAKQFLSTIGSSFRGSDAFQESFANMSYSPISQYGIGILSCFLICDSMVIETLKEGAEPCRFTIERIGGEWKYEKGARPLPGTTVCLHLDDYGREIKLGECLEKYFLCPEIPIEYRDGDTGIETLRAEWSASRVFDKFLNTSDDAESSVFQEVLALPGSDYDLLIVRWRGTVEGNALVFNHGIYVGRAAIPGLSYSSYVCINLHTDAVDLLLSRDGIKVNERWMAFVQSLFDRVFQHFLHSQTSVDELILNCSALVEERAWIEKEPETPVLEAQPFLRSFLNCAPFLALDDHGVVKTVALKDVSPDALQVYACCSRSISDELALVARLRGSGPLLVNPYRLPDVSDRATRSTTPLLGAYLEENGRLLETVDLRSLVLGNATEATDEGLTFVPTHVRLATFPTGIHPLVVVRDLAVVKVERYVMGKAYWGNLLLWKELVDKDRLDGYLDCFEDFYDDRFRDAIVLQKPPVVYVDALDEFIEKVVAAARESMLDPAAAAAAALYLQYLSYLPLVVDNLESCLIFLAAVERLEAQLAIALHVELPPPVLTRMAPAGKVFLSYFNEFGMDYIQIPAD
ncbi:MAG: ATP-binding protein [Armatimonadetes bacterium]|nr:ATP-binding protein [Armatimonadota bacterium]